MYEDPMGKPEIVEFVVYGRIWPEDEEDIVAARGAQIEDATHRMNFETFEECRLIGMHGENEPRTHRRRAAVGAALEMCRWANAALVVTTLEGLAGNGALMQQLVWSRVSVAFVEIPWPRIRTKPIVRETITHLYDFGQGKILWSLAGRRHPSSPSSTRPPGPERGQDRDPFGGGPVGFPDREARPRGGWKTPRLRIGPVIGPTRRPPPAASRGEEPRLANPPRSRDMGEHAPEARPTGSGPR
jgi:hypothetical protein